MKVEIKINKNTKFSIGDKVFYSKDGETGSYYTVRQVIVNTDIIINRNKKRSVSYISYSIASRGRGTIDAEEKYLYLSKHDAYKITRSRRKHQLESMQTKSMKLLHKKQKQLKNLEEQFKKVREKNDCW